jgi:hypothetical protein
VSACAHQILIGTIDALSVRQLPTSAPLGKPDVQSALFQSQLKSEYPSRFISLAFEQVVDFNLALTRPVTFITGNIDSSVAIDPSVALHRSTLNEYCENAVLLF